MKPLLIGIVGTPVVVVCVIMASNGLRTVSAQETTAVFSPFTLKRTVTGYNKAGVKQVTRTEIFAVRRDGSQVEARLDVNGVPADLRIIHDVPAKKRVVIESKTKSVTTYALPEGQVKLLLPATDCSATSSAQIQKVLGIDTVHRERKDDFQIQQVTIKEWLAPGLNCFPLQREDIIERNGELYARQVTSPVEIVQGDPDPALFTVPSASAERAPSEVMRLYGEAVGKPCLTCGTGKAAGMDDVYFRHRPRQ